MSARITPASIWTPTPEITQHNGRALHPKMTFFASPPPEIGPVVTAYSSVRNNKALPRIQWHFVFEALLMILLLIWLGGMFLGVGIFALLQGLFGNSQQVFILSLLVALAFLIIPIKLIADVCFDKEFVCSYVGQHGVAEYRRSKEGALDEKILLFANFKSLRKKIEQIYVKPYINKPWIKYAGTKYCFTWRDIQGKPAQFIFPNDNKAWFNNIKQKSSGRLARNKANNDTILGLFFSKSGRPRQNDPYYFAASAERIWTFIFLQHAQAELEQYGSARFLVAVGGLLEIQPGLLKVINSTGTYQYSSNEVQLGYKDGNVIIERANPENPRKGLDTCVIDPSMIDNLEAFFTLFRMMVLPGSES